MQELLHVQVYKQSQYSEYVGLPVHIVSDSGTQFTSSEFESFLSKNGIAHTCTAPGHPETNGLAERC